MGASLDSRLIKKVQFVLRDVDPTTDDNYFDPPHLWINRETDDVFLLVDVTAEVATWMKINLGNQSSYDYIFIPIDQAEDGTSPPDALAVITDTNGKISARTFAGDAVEDVLIPWIVPEDIDVNTGLFFKVRCIVTNGTGPSSEGVSFKLSGYARGTGDSLTGTFGDEVESNKTGMTYAQYILFETDLSEKVIITDLAAGETVILHLKRDTDDSDDDYAQVIGVIGISIKIKRTFSE
jgi:hypothetical protein